MRKGYTNNSLQQADSANGNRSDMSLDVLTLSFTAIVQMLMVTLKILHFVSLTIVSEKIEQKHVFLKSFYEFRDFIA